MVNVRPQNFSFHIQCQRAVGHKASERKQPLIFSLSLREHYDIVIGYAFLSSLLGQMLGIDGHEKVTFPKI